MKEFYSTPESITQGLLHFLRPSPTRILEPCAGFGHIVSVLRHNGNVVETNDVTPGVGAQHTFDATTDQFWKAANQAAWTITNPPFSLALPILKRALEYTPNVAFLLRLSFLEPTKDREPFLLKKPPSAILVTPRVSFTADRRKDNCTTAWMIWSETSPKGIFTLSRTGAYL